LLVTAKPDFPVFILLSLAFRRKGYYNRAAIQLPAPYVLRRRNPNISAVCQRFFYHINGIALPG